MKTFEPYIEERLKDLEVTIHSTDSKEAITIFLNKGSSFGSNHLTTKLTIDAIMSIDKNKEKDSTALDIGCGSGIVTILLLKLKYKTIKSIDIDSYVLTEARQNIISNFGHFPIAVSLTDEEVHLLEYEFDLVAANISGNFIPENLKTISNLVKPNGHLVISGFNCEKEKKFTDLGNQHQLALYSKFIRKPWISLIFKRY